MAGTLYDLIPGLREAEEAFREDQLEAFTGIEPPIRGIEVRPFTPRMLMELDGVGNDFMRDVKAPRVEDLAMFIWRVSRDFDRLNYWRRRRFLWRFRSVPYGPAVDEVRDYLRRSYAPMPMVASENSQTVAAWPSFVVHLFASEYHWTEDTVLDLPFRRLWQYLNRILEKQDPKYKQKSAVAIRLRAEWLQKMNTRNGSPIPGAN